MGTNKIKQANRKWRHEMKRRQKRQKLKVQSAKKKQNVNQIYRRIQSSVLLGSEDV